MLHTNSTWDVIVVGAGPGGTTAARGLANAGLRVLLLEKEKIPRYKPCGGGLTAKVRNVLQVDFSPTIEDTINHVSVAHGVVRHARQIRCTIDGTRRARGCRGPRCAAGDAHHVRQRWCGRFDA